jgi:putative effector of murein hydrolase
MVVVRYAALAALVVWLGGLSAAATGDHAARIVWLEHVCAGVLLVSLLTMKFVGPPPRGFVPRLTIAVLMSAVALVERWESPSVLPVLINLGLGFVLLSWYAHE